MVDAPDIFPKLEAPYERKNRHGEYTVTENVRDKYKWVFEQAQEVDAVEKIDGENIAVYVKDGEIKDVARRNDNRKMSRVEPYKPRNHYIVRGIQNSTSRFSYLEKDLKENGWYFGELVGPDLHGNPYDLSENLFVPFDWLRRKATYKSYGKYSVKPENISEWFENEIFSIFYSLMHNVDLKDATVSDGVFVEGIVFLHPNFNGPMKKSNIRSEESEKYGSVATDFVKLRRDMYDWYY